MGVLLAALSSLVYGSADFLGGFASKRTDGVVVTFVSQACGCVVLAVALALWPEVTVTAGDIWWGVAAGVGGGLGLMLFYPALAAGPMSVVAPTTAICGAIVPLVVGVVLGERPSVPALCGVVIALPAIVLVARERDEGVAGVRRSTLLHAVLAGVGFGAFFVCLSRADSSSGLWPLVGARIGSLGMLTIVLILTRRRVVVATGSWGLVIAAGWGDIVANSLYVLAVGMGLLSVVAVIGSMYPASTVILAQVILGERMQRAQVIGLVLAGAAVALVAIG
jgi:uncharacterized membrane protein